MSGGGTVNFQPATRRELHQVVADVEDSSIIEPSTLGIEAACATGTQTADSAHSSHVGDGSRTITPSYAQRLSPELLTIIFKHFIKDTRQSYLRHLDLIVVTHVCRFWREVVLNIPQLWTDIFIGDKTKDDCVHAHLARSKQMPFCLATVIRGDVVPTKGLESALREFNRVHTAKLYMPSSMFQDLVELLPPKALALRRLELNGGSIEKSLAHLPIFPLSFSNFIVPSLKIFKLRSFCLDWQRISFPRTLTELDVSIELPYSDVDTVSHEEILNVVRNLPLLENIGLRDVLMPLPPATTSLPPVTSPIGLPRLRDLGLTAEPLVCLTFLNNLLIPPTTSIYLEFNDHPIPDYGVLFPSLLANLNQSISEGDERQTVHELYLSNSSIAFWKRTSVTRDSSASQQQEWKTTGLEICFFRFLELGGLAQDVDEFFDFLAHFPIHDARAFRTSDLFPCSKVWPAMFSLMPHIEQITLDGLSPGPARILNSKRPVAGSSGFLQQEYILPKLEELILYETWFRFRPPHPSAKFLCVRELCTVILERQMAGLVLKRIVVTNCVNMDERDISLMRSMLQGSGIDICWDERTYRERIEQMEDVENPPEPDNSDDDSWFDRSECDSDSDEDSEDDDTDDDDDPYP